MAQSFQVDLVLPQPPDQVQADARGALIDPARRLGLRPTQQTPGRIEFRPKWQFPFLVMLYHYLRGERMSVTFAPADGGGTRVSLAGKVAPAKQAAASDPDHWSESLGRPPA